jgi:hypothetical protein
LRFTSRKIGCNARVYGATKEEVLEAIELASVLGLHACAVVHA